MSKMKKFMEDVLTMPYFKNHAAESGAVHNTAKHENAVADKLRKHGYSFNREGGIRQNQRDAWLDGEDHSDIPDNSYISQPCGSNNSPDFIVKSEGRLYFLECKSVKGGTPMYNSGVPKAEYIYILCSEKHDQTTIYFGGDVLPVKEAQLIKEHIAVARKRDEEFNKEFGNDYGISYYTRPMIQHKGLNKDYFKHPMRKQLEQKVLNAV